MPELRLENSIIDDRYEADRCLGRGSYAEIFLAYDRARNGEPVIIKALNMTLQGTLDPELEQTLLENFQNEALALDKVRHPNIIRRLGHGTAADLQGTPFHYLVLEYMAGGDMLSLCRKRPLDLQRTLVYFQQVAEALAFAHSQRVIHRDIKPNNLLLSEDHRIVKIADFGVAKMSHDDSIEITRVGTDVYAPPEHHPDSPSGALDQKLTPSADIYSLAKSIYTMMTSRAPRRFSRQPISELPEELAKEPWADDLLSVLRKATQTLVKDRYQSVHEFWKDFARVGTKQAADSEATVVRSRLSGASGVGSSDKAAARPDFQGLSARPYEAGRLQKARIVVDLPARPVAVEEESAAGPPGASAHKAQGLSGHENGSGRPALEHTPAGEAPRNAPQMQDARKGDRAFQKGATAAVAVGGRETLADKPGAFATKQRQALDGPEKSLFDDLRAIITSEWLRRVFVLFMIVALMGVATSIYHYYAEREPWSPPIPGLPTIFQSREGVVFGRANVNLRGEPAFGANVLAEMPQGTRVRVIDSRDNWIKVRILEWKGSVPENAPEEGWMDKRYVRRD
ncbi:MAG TPA: serine/threonine protein kinase [Blastocatellia bacterium]|nr:serine/threonine protein kinase [Blastocatellia bacterium]